MVILSYLLFYSLVLFAISSFFGWRGFRKYYRRTGQMETRFMFASRVLGISQLLSLCLFFAFMVATVGYGLFVASLIVFANAVAAVLVFILSVLVYPRAEKWALEGRVEPTNQGFATSTPRFRPYAYVVAGILIPIVLFNTFNGKEIFNEVLMHFTLFTGNVDLVKNQPYEHQQRRLYASLAKEKQDPSICDNIEVPLYRANCYKAADPEFSQYEETCALYMRQGDAEQADYIQRDCLLNKIRQSANTLTCDSIASQFANNRQIDRIVSECRLHTTAGN